MLPRVHEIAPLWAHAAYDEVHRVGYFVPDFADFGVQAISADNLP